MCCIYNTVVQRWTMRDNLFHRESRAEPFGHFLLHPIFESRQLMSLPDAGTPMIDIEVKLRPSKKCENRGTWNKWWSQPEA